MAVQTVAIDEGKLNAFLGQVIGELGATVNAGLIVIGDRLGLYKAMAGAGPISSAQLAEKTGLAERYVREWLNAQAAGGYVTYDATAQRYELPAEQALALANEDSPAFVGGAFELATATLKSIPQIESSFRTGAGFGWHQHDRGVATGCERFFRPGYNANLVTSWLPALAIQRLRLPPRIDRARRPEGGGCGAAGPHQVRRGACIVVSRQRLRPGHDVRLPTRHGGPRGCGPSRAAGTRTRRHLDDRRTGRRRSRGGEPQPGRARVLRVLELPLHPQLAVAGRRSCPRRPGRGGAHP